MFTVKTSSAETQKDSVLGEVSSMETQFFQMSL